MRGIQDFSYISHRLGRDKGQDFLHREIEIGFYREPIVLDLDYVVNQSCKLSVVNRGHKLLTSIDSAHNLPPEMTIAGYTPVHFIGVLVHMLGIFLGHKLFVNLIVGDIGEVASG